MRHVVKRDDGCWSWPFAHTDRGYAIGNINSKGIRLHRFLYASKNGATTLHLHHKCENRGCVNPDHLLPVTRQEHAQIHKTWLVLNERQRSKTHCKHGHSLDDAYVYPAGRKCRSCLKIRNALYKGTS